MSQKVAIIQTHFPVLQLPLPAAPIVRKKLRQSCSQLLLFPPCQQAKTVWMSTGQLYKRTSPVASSPLPANRDGPTDLSYKRDLSPYWRVRGHLTLHDNLLLYGSHIVVPKSLKATILQKIHKEHQGIQRCCQCTTLLVRWPGVSKDIEQLVKLCPICAKASPLHREPLIYSPLPNDPWKKVDRSTYLLVVDYFSRFIEISRSYLLLTPDKLP